jgi:manganese transport protein
VYLSKTEAAVLPTPLRTPARRRLWPLLGPAFVAAVAYVDPGNFATNFSGGAAFGYTLLWVIVTANLMAMLIQSLTAKLGMATGRDLATLCRERLPRPVTWGLWAQAEAVAIATDLAEIVGGAVALHLLFGVPLPLGGLITAGVAFVLLAAQSRGYRPFERVITGLLLVIGLGFGYTLVGSGVDLGGVAGGMVPSFEGTDSIVLATGILGATVMPHVIYVHSALTPGRYGDVVTAGRSTAGRRRLLRAQRLDVLLAMGLAGLVNAAMLIIAAQLFTGGDQAYRSSGPASCAGTSRCWPGA